MARKSDLEKALLEGVSKQRPVTPYDKELIARYISFRGKIRAFEASIKTQGVMMEIENGDQSFLKVHPAIPEMRQISAAMNAILKTLGLDAKSLYDMKIDEEDEGGLLD